MKQWIPFEIDRTNRVLLTRQVAGGIRAAIDAGRYGKGDVLPTRREIADRLAVGEVTVRAALAELSAEGLLVSRPGVGCVVVGRGAAGARRRRVLDVMGEDVGSFSACVSSHVLRQDLTRAGIAYENIALPSGANERDYLRMLKERLADGPDFVLLRACNERFEILRRVIAKSGAPYLVTFGGVGQGGRCVGTVSFDTSEAVAALVADCVRAKVRSVLQVDQGVDSYIDASAALEACGISVERLSMRQSVHALADLDAIVAEGARLMSARLAAAPLPDLIFVMNDFLAGGVISTLLRKGVRIPQDVSVVAYANKGSGFFFPRPFASFEYDPRAGARRVARGIVQWFRTGRFPAALTNRPVYYRGETFPV